MYKNSKSTGYKSAKNPKIINEERLHLVLILGIILIAMWLRLWQLPITPPGLEYDEAINGLDAIWMLKTKTPYLFVNSLHGREALFLYPSAMFIFLLGASPFALRLTSVLAGILAIPLIYRLTIILFFRNPQRYWLALIAAAGLATSLWHILMSRVGLRVVLIPTFFILMAYFFWRGRQMQAYRQGWRLYGYFVGAGVVLGLSQYTYVSARLFPLIFLLTVGGGWWSNRLTHKSEARILWLGLLIMAVVSALIFLPLGFQFLENADDFGRRAGQVNFQVQWTFDGLIAFTQHIGQSFTLFLGGSDPRIRHHLIERAVFDWLILVSFWFGVVVALKYWRRHEFLFLLSGVFVLWLPGLLSVDPIHSPRTSGLLPAFFILVAVGLLQLVTWSTAKLALPLRRIHVGLISLGLVMLVSGGINTFDYFNRWANHPLVYKEYKGPYIDLAQYAVSLSQTNDVVLPYKFYAYPPVRYVLRDYFQESLSLAPTSPSQVDERPVIYLNGFDDLSSSLLIRLTYDETGKGIAYLFPSPISGFGNSPVQLIQGRRTNIIGSSQIVDKSLLTRISLVNQIESTLFIWGEHIHLAGYQLASSLIKAGEPGVITFFWEGLKEADLDHKIFIQILDDQGESISQLEESIIKEDIQYYENRDGYVSQQHLFWTGPDLASGLYLLRFGLFNPKTGQRIPITTTEANFVGDQIMLTLFYVSANGIDPRSPDTVLQVNLGQEIELLGYSLDQLSSQTLPNKLDVYLYWQAIDIVNSDYTAFVQLLDSQNQVISQWDSQPLAGLFPTSRWHSNQTVLSKFSLSLDRELVPGTYRLVTGMYDFSTGVRLSVLDTAGHLLPDNLITLTQITVP